MQKQVFVPHVDKFMRATASFRFVSKAVKVIQHFGRRPYARVPENQDPFACCVFEKSKLKFPLVLFVFLC